MTVTVKCPQCSLAKTFDDSGVIPLEWKNEAGELLCPNCDVPMQPIGERQTMAAEDAFKEAQTTLREAPATSAPIETLETLTKRLHEIDASRRRVEEAQADWERAKKDASEARKEYDGAVTNHLNVVRRLTQVNAADPPLPLFTKEAEAAAQEEAPHAANETLLAKLADAGAPMTVEQIAGWTQEMRAEAWEWATREGSVESTPEHVALAATEPESTVVA